MCSLSGAFENDRSSQRHGQTETQFSSESSSSCNHRYIIIIIISAHSSSHHWCMNLHLCVCVLDFSPTFTSTHVTSAAASPVPAELHAKLALIKHTAEKVQHPIIIFTPHQRQEWSDKHLRTVMAVVLFILMVTLLWTSCVFSSDTPDSHHERNKLNEVCQRDTQNM